MVAEGRISHGQNEDSSDDERYITPPSTPAAKRISLHKYIVQTQTTIIIIECVTL